MEKRKWLWKRKPSERSPGETESSESISSHSERYSDDQDGLKALPNENTQSPEVTSKATASSDEMDDSVKILTEKLSAALVNVSAKEDLVKQHAKVTEEAVAGWEKAENEVTLLKQQLEVVMKKNSALEDRGNHLDGALKECVRQLRQGREEQEQKVQEAVLEKTGEWESKKNELEVHIEFLESENSALKEKQTESPASVDPDLLLKLEFLERENKSLKDKLLSLYEELEIMTIERDLSVQVAENASKQHLDSIKKVAKLEAECRRLQLSNRKSLLSHDQKSVSASSNYVESLTDSQSDSGERSTLVTELDQIKSEKSLRGSITGSPVDMDIMDDFLEMERLVALPKSETKDKKQYSDVNSADNQLKSDFEAMSCRVVELEEKLKTVEAEKNELEKVLVASSYEENQLKADFEAMSHRVVELVEKLKTAEAEKTECRNSDEENQLRVDFEAMSSRVFQLEEKLKTVEAEKIQLEEAVASSQNAYVESQFQLKSAEMKLEALLKELDGVNESKEILEVQLTEIEAEAQTMSLQVKMVKEEIVKEKGFSNELASKCRELEDELARKSQEIELKEAATANGNAKIEQEELDVAAGKLADCQKTIASLGRQLQSLATLEDFLIDTANLPGFSGDGEFWKLHSNETFISKNNPDQAKVPLENSSSFMNGDADEKSPPSLSSSTSSKSRNGFGKLFTRTKSGIQLENKQQS